MILETIPVGSLEANCYCLASEENSQAIIIDPGADAGRIKRLLARYNLTAAFIVNTHGHYDHIGADDKFNVPVYIHRADAPLLENPELNLSNFLFSSFRVKSQVKILEDKENIELGNMRLEVIHTPGHTPGGICLFMQQPENKVLFTGDSLFFHGIGRTDFPGASLKLLVSSIQARLWNLPPETIVYPGHGPVSTIGEEKENNPFLINR